MWVILVYIMCKVIIKGNVIINEYNIILCYIFSLLEFLCLFLGLFFLKFERRE